MPLEPLLEPVSQQPPGCPSALELPDAATCTWFSDVVLSWFERCGRTKLPWQNPATPYRVWLAEIMLQQTQVKTVIPYFERFVAHFDSIGMLAEADEDEVLHLWSGLGYYARGRNLHRCAKRLLRDFDAQLPADLEQLQALPGIGQSTAGAIYSLAFNRTAAILDGNVKRVLTRCFQLEGWPGQGATLKNLWRLSKRLIPGTRCGPYNQAMMDLGAILCTRSKPDCPNCPLKARCLARANGRQSELPTPKPPRKKPLRRECYIWCENQQGGVLLIKRPPRGIWGGLWCLPRLEEFDRRAEWQPGAGAPQRQFLHHFSHFTLEATVLNVDAIVRTQIMDEAITTWYDPIRPPKLGLATPFQHLLHPDISAT